MSEAKIKVKNLLLQYKISKITLENLLYIVEQQGFEILEYSQFEQHDSVWEIIRKLELTTYALSGQAFAYQCGRTKIVFLCDELSANEKLYALAHEEGHILCGHLTNDNNYIEQEHLANEIAHYLLNPPSSLKAWLTILEHKKTLTAVIAVVGILAIILGISMFIYQNTRYYGNYYVTENGLKYHEADCMTIKGKADIRRFTDEDFASGEYEPCHVCLP